MPSSTSAAVVALALACFTPVTALANTFPIFSKDGKQATVVLQGSPSDLDAQRLFDLLTVPPQDEQGKITKKVKFTGPDSIDAMSIVCAFSKLIPGNGSCIIVLKAAAGMTIDSSAHHALYEMSLGDAQRFASLFQATTSTPAYSSTDRHLELEIIRDESGAALKTMFGYH